MGLATKIKRIFTPDTLKSRQSQVGETNMRSKDGSRGASSNATDDTPADHNGVDKIGLFKRHRPRDSGSELGHDSRFIEHVQVDPSFPRHPPTDTTGTRTKGPASNDLPDSSDQTRGLTPGVGAVGGGTYPSEMATGPSIRKVWAAEGMGASASNKAGNRSDHLTLQGVGDNPAYDRNYSRLNLQNTRAYKSDALLSIPERSIVDGYGKEQSAEGKLKDT
ncbi:hypothetical protein VSDG_03377 [Cytospora chrysosperma]|uniref:Uncharacterized protein n=1 Tax=Cytospora chrysosperma TaxID=252740 RepID=A0A423WB40_CYTCH|nr:hypothetical protein VSDG_03377 [Valsa sordida]